MGIILSKVIDNVCGTCDGLGKYPMYRTCYVCHGTGYIYSVQGTFIDMYQSIKDVVIKKNGLRWKYDNTRLEVQK